MKIDLTPTFEVLTRLQREMGASEEPELPPAVLVALAETGVETTIVDLPPNPEGVIAWRGQVVVLYIRDQMTWAGHATSYRYHVAECSTIESMRARGRGERYVVTNRADGRFPVRKDSDEEVQLLDMQVCRNCMSRLDWDGYRTATSTERTRIVAGFDIAEFFSTYRTAGQTAPQRPAPPQRPPPPPVQVAVAAPPPHEEPAGLVWPFTIADAQFRRVASHLRDYGSISESELHEMVGGPRRARRFDLSLEDWFADAPFRVQVRSTSGMKSYHRMPR